MSMVGVSDIVGKDESWIEDCVDGSDVLAAARPAKVTVAAASTVLSLRLTSLVCD